MSKIFHNSFTLFPVFYGAQFVIVSLCVSVCRHYFCRIYATALYMFDKPTPPVANLLTSNQQKEYCILFSD